MSNVWSHERNQMKLSSSIGIALSKIYFKNFVVENEISNLSGNLKYLMFSKNVLNKKNNYFQYCVSFSHQNVLLYICINYKHLIQLLLKLKKVY